MYDGISQFYDMFMQDTDYDGWSKFCLRHIDGEEGIDVGCGSGELTFRLIAAKKRVVGVDFSPQMVSEAKAKAKKKGISADFAVMDAEKLEYFRRVDFVTAICDVVNYLKNPLAFFKRAKSILKDDGVFIFDVSTEYKIKTVLANNTFSDETDEVIYLWNNFLAKNYVDMQLYFFKKDSDGRYTRFVEEQRQYIHTRQALEQMLRTAGFTKIEAYSSRFSKTIKEDEERIFFVAK